MEDVSSIEIGLNGGLSHAEIARKIYLSYPTNIFVGNEETQYEIFNSISNFFSIPFSSIQVVGSAKTGFSFYQNRRFIQGESDLDIAIIDTDLFVKYVDAVFVDTKGFSSLTKFPFRNNRSTFNEYKSYLCKGIFRPDLMPSGELRAEWNSFFGKLSSKHLDLFKSINAGIYLSQNFFEHKQKQSIKDYIKNKASPND